MLKQCYERGLGLVQGTNHGTQSKSAGLTEPRAIGQSNVTGLHPIHSGAPPISKVSGTCA